MMILLKMQRYSAKMFLSNESVTKGELRVNFVLIDSLINEISFTSNEV